VYAASEGASGETRAEPGVLRRRREAKKVAVQLIRDVGFDPVDAGRLRIARYTERSRCSSPSLRTRERRP